ncbi:MAG: peptidoglycan-binding protein [Planctomycetota bacterium]
MAKISVGSGDSVPSIAKTHGFFWQSLWDLPENAALKATRKDPNLLYEGDEVFVPKPREKLEVRPAGATHVFKRLGDPVKFKLRLTRAGKPRASEPYVLVLGDETIEGATDGDGKLETFVPGNVTEGKLLLKNGKEEYPLRISRLDPIETTSGVQQRLNNLGFSCGPEDGKPNARTRQALSSFQAKHALAATGEADAATLAKIKSLHA